MKTLLESIKDKDPDKVSLSLASSLDAVAQLELLQVYFFSELQIIFLCQWEVPNVMYWIVMLSVLGLPLLSMLPFASDLLSDGFFDRPQGCPSCCLSSI